MSYLAIDPGKTTGWATFNGDGSLDKFGQIKDGDFDDWLQESITSDLTTVIVESFGAMYKGQHTVQNKHRILTTERIGAIKTMCRVHGVKVVEQPNTVKQMGYLYANHKPPKNHNISHGHDAYSHGVYYLQRNGVRRPQMSKEVS